MELERCDDASPVWVRDFTAGGELFLLLSLLACEWVQGDLFVGALLYDEGLCWGFGRSGRDGNNVEFGFWDVYLQGRCCMESSGSTWQLSEGTRFSYDGLLPVTNGVLERRRGE